MTMKRLGLALAAAAALSALPLAAHAQSTGRIHSSGGDSAAKPDAAGPKLDAKTIAANKARGLKEAPALLAASDVKTCQIADANYLGTGDAKGADGKPAGKLTAYEVACQEGPGYLLFSTSGQPKPQTVNCIVASGGTGNKCALPQNVDFKAALAPYVKKAGRACDISGQRYVGSTTADSLTYYEVACGATPGFLLAVSEAAADKPPTATDCLALQGTPQACQLSSKTQMLQTYADAVAKSGKTCTVSDVRAIGQDKNTHAVYTEIGCGTSPGFILVSDAAGAYKSTIDCGKADSLGGCKLTDVATAQTTDAAAYTKLAAKAGFPCNVKQYRYIGTDKQNREIVELACSDHPNGAFAALSETGKSDIYDCVRGAALSGTECKLTDKALAYPKYTEALAAKGRTTCKVSGAGLLGRTQAGTDYVETSCADGAPGWVIGFKAGVTTPDEVLTCKQATNSGLPCKLPTNVGANKG